MTGDADARQACTGMVEHIPVAWATPEGTGRGTPLALWIPALGIDKAWVVPFLGELAAVGFVAASFDPWRHGERGSESAEEIRARVFGGFRRQMWPILGHTTLDALRVIDWALDALGAGPTVVAGGISMGGDVAVALAGVDPRISCVAAIGSTPDWTRPGMRDLADPSRVLPQGEPDAYARWFYEHLDPLTHPDAFSRGPAIAFECGEQDSHVPADGARRFKSALKAAGQQVRVTIHPGVGHVDAVQSPELHQRCLDWFVQHAAPGGR